MGKCRVTMCLLSPNGERASNLGLPYKMYKSDPSLLCFDTQKETLCRHPHSNLSFLRTVNGIYLHLQYASVHPLTHLYYQPQRLDQ